MKTLYVRQNKLSGRERYSVRDESGADVYRVEGKLLTLTRRLLIYDMTGAEAAEVRQILLTLRLRFLLRIRGEDVAEIEYKLATIPRYIVKGLGWEITGDLWEHEYEITGADGTVARIGKKLSPWEDSYRVDIPDPRNEITVLAAVLAIDMVLKQTAAASASV